MGKKIPDGFPLNQAWTCGNMDQRTEGNYYILSFLFLTQYFLFPNKVKIFSKITNEAFSVPFLILNDA